MPIVYRNYIAEDFPKVKQMCEENNINVPIESMVYVAVEDDKQEDELLGIVGIKGEIFIEPLIAVNPLVGRTLYSKTLDTLKKQGVKKVRCICNKDAAKVFAKAGFRQIESEKILMEREI